MRNLLKERLMSFKQGKGNRISDSAPRKKEYDTDLKGF